jgi:hypothetical protein
MPDREAGAGGIGLVDVVSTTIVFISVGAGVTVGAETWQPAVSRASNARKRIEKGKLILSWILI